MKILLAIGILLLGSNLTAQHSSAVLRTKSEVTEIKKILKEESLAYFNRDYPALAATWTQDENSVVAWNGKDGGYTHMRGWDEIGAYYKTSIEKNKKITYPDFRVSDLAVDVHGDFAYVVYNEYVANKTMLYSKVPGIKTLIKQDGEWKLHSIISFWDRNYQYTAKEVDQMMENSKLETFRSK